MKVTLIYAISLASCFASCLLYRVVYSLNIYTRRFFIVWFRKWLLFVLIAQRREGSNAITPLAGGLIITYVIANIFCLTFRISTTAELSNRASSLFSFNLLPIYLGSRTNIILDRLLGIQLSELSILHRWMGRLCVLHALVHSIVHFTLLLRRIATVEILLLTIATLLAILSILPVRRNAYELFAKSHLLFALLLLGALWVHVPKTDRFTVTMLSVVSAVWVSQQILWGFYLHFQNGGFQSSTIASLKCITQPEGGTVLCNLKVPLRTRRRIIPGQYVYVTIPNMPHRRFSILQSHPYMIAWVSPSIDQTGEYMHLWLECQSGFSNDVQFCKGGIASVVIDGPYGGGYNLNGYDKVLFVASGIGIAAHLLAIRHLLQAHEDRTARVRRICLVWVLDSGVQYKLAEDILHSLLDEKILNKRSILNIIVVSPSRLVDPVESKGLFLYDQPVDLKWVVDKEWSAEAGNMAVVACGHPKFEQYVRFAIRSNKNDIRLFSSEFQPGGRSSGAHRQPIVSSETP